MHSKIGSAHRKRKIAIATCQAYPNLYADEQAIVGRLATLGIDASVVVWNAPDVRWQEFDRIVLRSMWDYWENVHSFVGWLDGVARQKIELINPYQLVSWNLDKRYLAELERKGVNIIPTRFVEPELHADVARIVDAFGWTSVVLKPAISGGAFRTFRVDATDSIAVRNAFREIGPITAMIQPFVPEIERGEWSLIFFDQQFSHAVVKTPKHGDFRVQSDFGGTFRPKTPPSWLIATAQSIVDLLPVPPVYVRIDGIERDDAFALMEVEAIDPYLFMLERPDALLRYVDAIARDTAGMQMA